MKHKLWFFLKKPPTLVANLLLQYIHVDNYRACHSYDVQSVALPIRKLAKSHDFVIYNNDSEVSSMSSFIDTKDLWELLQ